MPDTPYLLKSVHEEFAIRMDEEHKRQNRRISSLEDSVKDISSLTTSVASLAKSVEQMAKAQEKQGKRLEALEQKPAKKWESFVDKVVWAVAAALIAFILSYLGLG
jgi:predicted outer membrane protein